jgi:hypothetical protein
MNWKKLNEQGFMTYRGFCRYLENWGKDLPVKGNT